MVFSIGTVPFYLLTNSEKEMHVLPNLPNNSHFYFIDISHSNGFEVISHCSFICFSLMINVWYWASCHVFISSLEKSLFKSFVHFWIMGCWVFLVVVSHFRTSLHILEISCLSDTCFANICSHPVGWLFILFIFFWCIKFFEFHEVVCLFFLLFPVPLVSYARNLCQSQCHEDFNQCFLLTVL